MMKQVIFLDHGYSFRNVRAIRVLKEIVGGCLKAVVALKTKPTTPTPDPAQNPDWDPAQNSARERKQGSFKRTCVQLDNDKDDEGEEEDEGIRAGGEEHEDEKRDNEAQERKEQDEERQKIVILAPRERVREQELM